MWWFELEWSPQVHIFGSGAIKRGDLVGVDRCGLGESMSVGVDFEVSNE